MQKIAILGGTGFIGRHLIRELEDDYEVVILTRTPEKHKNLVKRNVVVIKADYNNPASFAAILSTVDGVVNLVGESVGSMWTKSKKEKIYQSRIFTSRMLVEAFQLAMKKPFVFNSGFWYGCLWDVFRRS